MLSAGLARFAGRLDHLGSLPRRSSRPFSPRRRPTIGWCTISRSDWPPDRQWCVPACRVVAVQGHRVLAFPTEDSGTTMFWEQFRSRGAKPQATGYRRPRINRDRCCMSGTFHDCWFLTGATAVGKTAVGLALAQRLGAEIISLDSMAIYRGMDIGTAKPTAAERAVVPHHLIDIVDPADEYSVAQYVAAAAADGRRLAGPRPRGAVCRRHAAVFEGPVARPVRRPAGRLADCAARSNRSWRASANMRSTSGWCKSTRWRPATFIPTIRDG